MSIYTFIGIVLMAAGQMMVGLERVNPLAISVTLCALGVIGSGNCVGSSLGTDRHRFRHGHQQVGDFLADPAPGSEPDPARAQRRQVANPGLAFRA